MSYAQRGPDGRKAKNLGEQCGALVQAIADEYQRTRQTRLRIFFKQPSSTPPTCKTRHCKTQPCGLEAEHARCSRSCRRRICQPVCQREWERRVTFRPRWRGLSELHHCRFDRGNFQRSTTRKVQTRVTCDHASATSHGLTAERGGAIGSLRRNRKRPERTSPGSLTLYLIA